MLEVPPTELVTHMNTRTPCSHCGETAARIIDGYCEPCREPIRCDCGRGSYTVLSYNDHCLQCELEPGGFAWQREEMDRRHGGGW